MKRPFRSPILFFAALLIAGCAQLGLQAPQSFQDKAYAAALTIDAVQKNASTLLKAGKISPADAENVARATEIAIQGISVARTYEATSPATANNRLDAAVAGLTALSAYLATQGAK